MPEVSDIATGTGLFVRLLVLPDGRLAAAFSDGMTFLLANARRANPKRDRKTGRLRSGLIVVGDRS